MAKNMDLHYDREKDLMAAFEAVDKSGNGIVSTAELRDILSNYGEKLTNSEIDEFIYQSIDDDGQVKYAEFVKIYERNTLSPRPQKQVSFKGDDCSAFIDTEEDQRRKTQKELFTLLIENKEQEFLENSLYIFNSRNRFRINLLYITKSNSFHTAILILVVLNSVMYAISDYRYIDNDGQLSSKTSWRNQIVETGDSIFVGLFTIECVVKVIALGFRGLGKVHLIIYHFHK